MVDCDSGPESESVKFYRLQLRLRLRPKRSTPTDSNSGLDSDSAALPRIIANAVGIVDFERNNDKKYHTDARNAKRIKLTPPEVINKTSELYRF